MWVGLGRRLNLPVAELEGLARKAERRVHLRRCPTQVGLSTNKRYCSGNIECKIRLVCRRHSTSGSKRESEYSYCTYSKVHRAHEIVISQRTAYSTASVNGTFRLSMSGRRLPFPLQHPLMRWRASVFPPGPRKRAAAALHSERNSSQRKY